VDRNSGGEKEHKTRWRGGGGKELSLFAAETNVAVSVLINSSLPSEG